MLKNAARNSPGIPYWSSADMTAASSSASSNCTASPVIVSFTAPRTLPCKTAGVPFAPDPPHCWGAQYVPAATSPPLFIP